MSRIPASSEAVGVFLTSESASEGVTAGWASNVKHVCSLDVLATETWLKVEDGCSTALHKPALEPYTHTYIYMSFPVL